MQRETPTCFAHAQKTMQNTTGDATCACSEFRSPPPPHELSFARGGALEVLHFADGDSPDNP